MSKNRTDTNILQVVNSSMCTGCGLCDPYCPVDAIQIKPTEQGLNEPVINFNVCTHCKFCLEVCGRYKLDYRKLRNTFYSNVSYDPLIGSYTSTYIGHAWKHELRWNASAGGAISAMLILAFDQNMIDVAIVTGPDPEDPVMTKSFIAHNPDDVLSSGGSRYAPSSVLKYLREIDPEDRVAIVGLPCQFESLRKMELINPNLGRKIKLRLGVFCSHNVSMLATEFVYRYFKISREDIVDLRYRGDGWPSGIRVRTSNGHEYKLSNQNSIWTKLFMSFIFAAPYCLLCTDHTSEMADLSFGDAWLPEIMENDDVGETVIISRTSVGENLLKEAVRRSRLEIENISTAKVIESQRWPLYFKKKLFYFKRELLSEKRFDVNSKDAEPPILTKNDQWLAQRAWFNSKNTCRKFIPMILNRLPSKVFINYTNRYSNKLWQEACEWWESIKE